MIARTPILLATFAVAGAIAALPASGQDAKPQVGCAGLTFTDKTGDSSGASNTDVIAGWFTNTADGLFANIQVANLDKTVSDGSTGSNWYFQWELAGAVRYVSVALDGGAFTYEYGTLANQAYSGEGSTTGKAYEGKDGIFSIKVPSAVAPAGKTLTNPYVHVGTSLSVAGTGLVSGADDGPDTAKGNNYVVGGCEDGAAATTPPPVTSTPSSTTPPASGLGLTVSPGKVSAKAAKKGIKFTLKAQAPLTKVSLSLATSKKKVVAKASVAKVSGKATVTLKPKSTLKPGRYTLSIKATNADGAKVSGAFTVTVKK